MPPAARAWGLGLLPLPRMSPVVAFGPGSAPSGHMEDSAAGTALQIPFAAAAAMVGSLVGQAESDASPVRDVGLFRLDDNLAGTILAMGAATVEAVGVLRQVCRRFRDTVDSNMFVWEHAVFPDLPVHSDVLTAEQLRHVLEVTAHARRRNMSAQLALSSALWIHAERTLYAVGGTLPDGCDVEHGSMGDSRLMVRPPRCRVAH